MQEAEEAKPATASPVVPPPQPEPEPKPEAELEQPEIFAAAILPPAAPVSAPAVGAPNLAAETAVAPTGLDHGKENGVPPPPELLAAPTNPSTEQVRLFLLCG